MSQTRRNRRSWAVFGLVKDVAVSVFSVARSCHELSTAGEGFETPRIGLMTPRMTAGRRLRADLDAALGHASAEAGYRIEWTEQELQIIATACDMADRVEVLKAMFATVGSTSTRLKVATELRQTQRSVVELVARVNPGDDRAKSERHVRAVGMRWDRRRKEA